MLEQPEKSGVLSAGYAHKRAKAWGAYSYRLKRRTYEVLESIRQAGISDRSRILDIGAAEGLMLQGIKAEMPAVECFGVEYSWELLAFSQAPWMHKICGDAQNLPFADASFAVIICTAVIEHLPYPKVMLQEAFRMLKNDGIIIITSPDPFWDRVASLFNKNDQHIQLFDIESIGLMLKDCGFMLEKTKKFMLSPVGLPSELAIEGLVDRLGFRFLFLNQLLVGRKK